MADQQEWTYNHHSILFSKQTANIRKWGTCIQTNRNSVRRKTKTLSLLPHLHFCILQPDCNVAVVNIECTFIHWSRSMHKHNSNSVTHFWFHSQRKPNISQVDRCCLLSLSTAENSAQIIVIYGIICYHQKCT